ncbi:MAG: class I SAM-dependent methyltransferase [Alphaproteobacteria bacterium]|nr:class I SAM-dependent methyltransferase [Alphaproteobacteria bacterium]MBV9420668.1 class I SAM-dependent methyltransferase [Alphaproteobacteria bacterium]MBV9540580.1 class I SAM-dependent methyltransferase [Alphaproteobacteria bacterium]MBV9904336.1 class I SAM-dependent methyltransferase [Alphaproteobacteria bacterium]
MGMIPSGVIERKWREAASNIHHGSLDFITPKGEKISVSGPKPGPRGTMHIKDWDVLSRTLSRGDIGLGEAYIDGMWETDDIEKLVSLFLMNMDSFDSFANGSFIQRWAFVLYDTLVRRNSISGSSHNIKDHYDVGNEFYSLWLDPSMTYSSALFAGQDKTLLEAQRSKYERILGKMAEPKSSILEIGCGWGGFAERATEEQHHVTGLTISPSQHRYATERLKSRDVDVRLEDYRKTRGTFDNIVSIEMFEAVGEHYWPAYFQTVAERLKRGGRAVIQTITIRDELFARYRVQSDFIRHYVFPGGMLPSLARFREEAEKAGLKVVSTFGFGQDYAETLRRWSKAMQAKKDEVMALGHDQKFFRNWQFYLGICAATFAVDRTDVVQVELANV